MVRGFEGFPAEGPAFLAALAKNNRKDWFEGRKDDYRKFLVAPAEGFVTEIGEPLKQLTPGLIADPRPGGSIFRPHRDVRFSKDKRPYKTHLGIRFAVETGGAKRPVGATPLYYFELGADEIYFGAGVKAFDKETLATFREVAASPAGAEAIGAALAAPLSQRFSVKGERLTRVPRPYAPNHPAAEWLRLKGLFVGRREPHPATLSSAGFIAHARQRFGLLAPVVNWLAGAVFQD